MFVSAWSVQDQSAGDIFRTHNGGKEWEALPAMHGKSVRAMAVSASDDKVVVAGALDGVYRSTDGGNNWQKISPSDGIVKNIESIAVDPKDPNTDLCRNLAPGVEDQRWRRQLAAHQQGHDRRFRCVLDHRQLG